MKTLMSAKARCLISGVAFGAACALMSTAASATTYTYTASAQDVVSSFSFLGSLGDNLAAGTDVTGAIGPVSIVPSGLGTDEAGFPIGGAFGTSYFNASSLDVKVGTNATGQITSWTITENIFASWPAFSGESPTDFFGRYAISLSNTGDSRTLTQENDAGFSPGSTTAGAGSFGATVSTTPLPATLPLFAGGLGLIGMIGRRKRKAAAVG